MEMDRVNESAAAKAMGQGSRITDFGVCQKSAKFRKSQEVYVLREVANLLRV
jgi:hypothetical protein